MPFEQCKIARKNRILPKQHKTWHKFYPRSQNFYKAVGHQVVPHPRSALLEYYIYQPTILEYNILQFTPLEYYNLEFTLRH